MKTGRIITFYSYKGGVGRSFALANIAAVLAKWGAKVLCVDWDLEAPGLHHFFPETLGKAKKSGLLHLLESAAITTTPKNRPVSWKTCVNTVLIGVTGKTVDLIVAGREAEDYVRRVHALDWQALYQQHALGEFLEVLRQEWAHDYDFVLLDSRTGLTDIGGICTIHLPDVVVPVFTANRQNMEGTAFMAGRINEQRREFFYSSGSAIIMPLLARWEEKDAPDDAKAWLPKIIEMLRPSYNVWRNQDATVERLVELLKIPYKAKWNFGERLAVLEESATDPGSVSYHLHLVAAILAMDFAETAMLAQEPDNYVILAGKEASLKRGPKKKPPVATKAMAIASKYSQLAAALKDELDTLEHDREAASAYEALLLRKLAILADRRAPLAEITAILVDINAIRRAAGRPVLKAPSVRPSSVKSAKAPIRKHSK